MRHVQSGVNWSTDRIGAVKPWSPADWCGYRSARCVARDRFVAADDHRRPRVQVFFLADDLRNFLQQAQNPRPALRRARVDQPGLEPEPQVGSDRRQTMVVGS